jgi:Flp pilus assembly pilin Flp
VFRNLDNRVAREEGQTMPEYAVVLSILTVACAAVFLVLSGSVAGAVTSVTGII